MSEMSKADKDSITEHLLRRSRIMSNESKFKVSRWQDKISVSRKLIIPG